MEQEQRQLSPQQQRKRKFLLMAPLLAIPFLTMFFWAVGGGEKKKETAVAAQKGFNSSLPDAHLKEEKNVDKMSYYDQAATDSVKKAQRVEASNRFGFMMPSKSRDTAASPVGFQPRKGYPPLQPYAGTPLGYKDPNEERVNEKLAALNAALGKAADGSGQQASAPSPGAPVPSPDVDRLEKMLQSMQHKQEANPEMQQISGIMDKLIAVEHPEIMRDSLRARAENERKGAYAVRGATALEDSMSVKSVFFDGNGQAQHAGENTFEAVIPEQQTLVTGSIVKMQLTEPVVIHGNAVPAGTYLNGIASLSGERLVISVKSIRKAGLILPVALQVYDEDGMEGIYIPGAITRDVAKQSMDEGINSVGMTSLDPSLGAQATAAGIQLAKTALSKKVRLVRVSVRPGYRIWLKDASSH